MDAAAQAAPPRAAKEADKTDSPEIRPLAPDYFDQILPEPVQVCGLTLKPLSVGRYRRMRREKISFVADEPIQIPPAQLAGDLFKAVLICSMTCADYEKFLAQPDCGRQIRKWARAVGFIAPKFTTWPVIGGWISKLCAPLLQYHAVEDANYILEEMQKFQQYIVDGQQAPAYWDETSDGVTSATHWSHAIECTLREKQNWSKEEIDEEPLTKALWDYFKSMESAGLVRIMSEAERADLETKLTPEQQEESRIAIEKLWRYKFGDAPMPGTEAASAAETPRPTSSS